jgi:GNAT superfamily N-acetyltransferase
MPAPTSAVHVRRAHIDEAPILAEMANDLNEHVGVHGRPFTAEIVRLDAFGPRPAFTAIVAELEGAVVGYAFYGEGYNTDLAARSMWLYDLFVVPAARRRGVGHALMAAVAVESMRAHHASLDWGVHVANAGALEFYRGVGAVEVQIRVMGVSGAPLRALADAARSDAGPGAR